MAKKGAQGISAEQAMQAQQIMQAYQQQQSASQGEKKSKKLTDMISESYQKVTGTITRLPVYKEKALTGLDGIVGSGLRSTGTMYAITSTALPLALVDPTGAALTAAFAGACAYVTINTTYKLCRDVAWLATYPLVRPAQFLSIIPHILSNPFRFLSGVVQAPFKFAGKIFTYPIKAKRTKVFAFGPDGKPTEGTKDAGVNKYASLAGKILGGAAGAGLIYGNPLSKLKDLGTYAVDYTKGLYKYTPKLAYSYIK